MGKADVRVVLVRKWVTLILLLLVSAALAGFIYSLSGRAYTRGGDAPFTEVRQVAGRLSDGSYSLAGLLAITAPALLDLLLFVPWGMLMFFWLDRPSRPVWLAYLLTGVLGMSFALALQVWQLSLPMRVTDTNDSLWNGLGAIAGGSLAQLRKRLRLRFE